MGEGKYKISRQGQSRKQKQILETSLLCVFRIVCIYCKEKNSNEGYRQIAIMDTITRSSNRGLQSSVSQVIGPWHHKSSDFLD